MPCLSAKSGGGIGLLDAQGGQPLYSVSKILLAKEFAHPVIERLGQLREQRAPQMPGLDLSADETRRLVKILDQGFDPPPALLESLKRLADPGRRPPELTWADGPA